MVCGFVPDERPGIWLFLVDVVVDGLLQLPGRSMDAASQLLFSECGEPAFDQVDPVGRGRREV